MITQEAEKIFLKNVKRLSAISPAEACFTAHGNSPFPSVPKLKEVIEIIKSIVFPDFFDQRRNSDHIRSYYIGANMETLFHILTHEISYAKNFGHEDSTDCPDDDSRKLALAFVDRLPELKRLIYTDVQAIYDNDPAVDNFAEIILCYPVVQAMIHYRVAHEILLLGIPVIPRILTEMAHSATGIDIHPGAKIGEYFAIDHGTGVVIGETCVIGNRVTIYQGVTLGAKNFSLDSHGHPMNIPRHPIIEDNVTIYSNATVLGRITVGHNSIIGGNIWLTESVPPNSRVIQAHPAGRLM